MEQSPRIIQKSVHVRYLKLRNLNRMVLSDAFLDAWAKASENDAKQVEYFIYLADTERIRCWTRRLLSSEISSKNIRELRKLASQLKIKHYGDMTRQEIIAEVQAIERQYNHDHAQSTDGGGDSEHPARVPVGDSVPRIPPKHD